LIPLETSLVTPRLKLVPVTARIAAAARAGGGAFSEVIGAALPPDWAPASLGLVGRAAYPAWGPTPPPMRAVAVHRQDNCVIGDFRFEPSLQAEDEVEIGYGVALAYRRRGYATEGAGAVIDWLFRDGGAAEIIAGCDRRNLASVRTLRRLGFWLDSSAGRAFWWVLTPELRREKQNAQN
jgi:[ribosomal protein S5]-alanine N-acetyltransferase